MAEKPWSSTAPPGEFRPYIPTERGDVPEFSVRAVVLGALFGLAFGAVTVYLALRAGLTVSASIPIAVLAIAIFKRFGASILENNIVQTAGSAGESVAAGVVFTLPALIFLGYPAEFNQISRIFWVALIGGCLGVLFMIPLRRYLIVREHGVLTYPEGTACADVLVAGEKGGSFAGRVFWGFGLGGLYKLLNEGFRFWQTTPTYAPAWYPGSTIAAAITPEYLGVGFILGIRISGIIVAGSVLSWMALIPMIKFFGASLPTPIFPSTVPIGEMGAGAIWGAYIRPIGAGAVTMAGLITLLRALPTIIGSLRAALGEVFGGIKSAVATTRIEKDLPLGIVFIGSVVLVAATWGFLWAWELVPGPGPGLAASLLVVVFGFLFVTVSSRIVGIIGSSSNPISGMTIATLMATSLLFLLAGWTESPYPAAALTIGALVCIAAANAGATSQDLKTGYLVGATPWKQQVALVIGVLASVAVIGWTITFLNNQYTVIEAREITLSEPLPSEARVVDTLTFEGRAFERVSVLGSRQIPDGTYYWNREAGKIEYQQRHGIGSLDLPAPQGVLMATVVNGILKRSLPWGLVLIGVFIVLVLELCGVRSLAFAVGLYLPISTTLPIFIGGVVSWLVQVSMKGKAEIGEVSSGALFSAGLIAGGSIAGLFGVAWLESARREAMAAAQRAGEVVAEGSLPFATGPKYWPAIADSHLSGVLMFALLAFILFQFGRKRLQE